jgi:aspartyl/asparaginyl-tRNA synthetase
MEITTGGQRIHDYETQVNKMRARGMDPADAASYLMIISTECRRMAGWESGWSGLPCAC